MNKMSNRHSCFNIFFLHVRYALHTALLPLRSLTLKILKKEQLILCSTRKDKIQFKLLLARSRGDDHVKEKRHGEAP